MINIHPPVILVSSNEVCSTIDYYRQNLENVVFLKANPGQFKKVCQNYKSNKK